MPTPRRRPSVLRLQFSAELGKAALPYLRRHLKAALPLLPANALGEVSIALVGDETMSALHARSHDDPTPTDVLTYELEHGPEGDVTEGQIVICVSEARRRAAERNIPVQRELLLYALHGVLHLTGHDDTTPKAYARMHALEDKILTALGIGATFRAPVPRGTAAGRKGRPQRRAARP